MTCPRSVVTEPPLALWNGNGMSTLPPDGHNSTAPTTTASPITLSAMTTRRAARGPSGAGPCAGGECATGYSVRPQQEAAQPLNGFDKVPGPR